MRRVQDDRIQVYYMDNWSWDYDEVIIPYPQCWLHDAFFETCLYYPFVGLELQEVYPSSLCES